MPDVSLHTVDGPALSEPLDRELVGDMVEPGTKIRLSDLVPEQVGRGAVVAILGPVPEDAGRAVGAWNLQQDVDGSLAECHRSDLASFRLAQDQRHMSLNGALHALHIRPPDHGSLGDPTPGLIQEGGQETQRSGRALVQPLDRLVGGQDDVRQTFPHPFFFELEKRVSFDPALVLDVPHEMVERSEIAIDRRDRHPIILPHDQKFRNRGHVDFPCPHLLDVFAPFLEDLRECQTHLAQAGLVTSAGFFRPTMALVEDIETVMEAGEAGMK